MLLRLLPVGFLFEDERGDVVVGTFAILAFRPCIVSRSMSRLNEILR